MPLTKPSREFLWPPLIMATVFLASGQTTLATPSFSFSPDKIAHFAVFGALATSVIRLSFLRDRGWRAALGVWLLVAGYGGLDEYRQSFTPGRSVEFDDWLADGLGAAAAVVLYQFCPRWRGLLEMKVRKMRDPGAATCP